MYTHVKETQQKMAYRRDCAILSELRVTTEDSSLNRLQITSEKVCHNRQKWTIRISHRSIVFEECQV